MSEREERFEKMLAEIQKNYADVCQKMEVLSGENKTKTVTYKQLWARKLKYQDMLALYKLYDLLEEF